MGPSRVVGSTSQRNNGPMRCHQQQLLKAQWTHPEPSAASLRKTMGPCEVSGSICYKCSGPIRRYRQHLSKKQWAQAKLASAAAANTMGPSGGIGSTFQSNNGPERSSRHHLLQMFWAHPAAPAAPLTSYQWQLNTMGPFEGVGSISAGTAHIINMGQIDTIGRISLNLEVGPLVVPVHFYSMGPCGLFQLQRSNCTWVVPTTTTKVFDIMCSHMLLQHVTLGLSQFR